MLYRFREIVPEAHAAKVTAFLEKKGYCDIVFSAGEIAFSCPFISAEEVKRMHYKDYCKMRNEVVGEMRLLLTKLKYQKNDVR